MLNNRQMQSLEKSSKKRAPFTFRKIISGQTLFQRSRLFLLIILSLLTFQSSGQTSNTINHFEPIYFNQNSDTIYNKYFSRLDSLGAYLQSDTTLVLQLHAYGNPVENPFFEIVFNRAKNTSEYLTSKFKIKMHENYLTNDNNRGVVGREDWEYSESERASLRKIEFIITRSK